MKACKQQRSVYDTLQERDSLALRHHMAEMEQRRPTGSPCRVCKRHCQLGDACPYWPGGRPPLRRGSLAFLRALTAVLAAPISD